MRAKAAVPDSSMRRGRRWRSRCTRASPKSVNCRSEEHTSQLQSRFDLVCRLLLEKKKNERRSADGLSEVAGCVRRHGPSLVAEDLLVGSTHHVDRGLVRHVRTECAVRK